MNRTHRSSPFPISVRKATRVRHYSIRTEEAYVGWIRRFIHFHGKRHAVEMAGLEVAAFLSHLAVDLSVAPATQNQALNALVFLYSEVTARPVGSDLAMTVAVHFVRQVRMSGLEINASIASDLTREKQSSAALLAPTEI